MPFDEGLYKKKYAFSFMKANWFLLKESEREFKWMIHES